MSVILNVQSLKTKTTALEDNFLKGAQLTNRDLERALNLYPDQTHEQDKASVTTASRVKRRPF